MKKPKTSSRALAQIKVSGLQETSRALTAVSKDAQDLKEVMFNAGVIVAKNARVPVDSGELISTLRVGKAKLKASVSIGSANGRGFYGSFIHKGAPKRGIKKNPFLLEARDKSKGQVIQTVNKGLSDVIKKHNLN